MSSASIALGARKAAAVSDGWCLTCWRGAVPRFRYSLACIRGFVAGIRFTVPWPMEDILRRSHAACPSGWCQWEFLSSTQGMAAAFAVWGWSKRGLFCAPGTLSCYKRCASDSLRTGTRRHENERVMVVLGLCLACGGALCSQFIFWSTPLLM